MSKANFCAAETHKKLHEVYMDMMSLSLIRIWSNDTLLLKSCQYQLAPGAVSDCSQGEARGRMVNTTATDIKGFSVIFLPPITSQA